MMKIYSTFQLFTGKSASAAIVLLAGLFFSAGLYAQTPCNEPINATVMSVTTSGATITWTPPSPAPWNGYDYWYTSIQGYFPVGGPVPSGSVNSPSVTFNQFTTDATIYVFIRSRCSPTPSTWDGPISFTTLSPGEGCPNGQYGAMPAETFTPQYTGQPETITTQGYAGQFSRLNVKANRQYIFSSSVNTDYITITADNAAVVAHGPTPLTYNSPFNEVLRFYTTTNASCGTQQTNRTRSVQAQLIPSSCQPPSGFYTSSITHNSAKLLWTNTSSGITGLQLYISTSNVAPGINEPDIDNVTGSDETITDLSPNTTYYYWMRTVCGQNLTNWAAGGSFTTQPAEVIGCTGALYGQMPASVFTPACSGAPEIVSTNMWGGMYSEITILPNRIYTFDSSVATDFFTIRDSFTSEGYASGTTPLVWSSGANTATIRVFLHTNSSCGSQIANRTFRITCQNATSCAAPGSISFPSVATNWANIKWVTASPLPASGYQYYFSTSNATPAVSAVPSGAIDATSLYLTGLQENTTYYFWVRANCGGAQSPWISGNSFTTVGANGGCTSFTDIYPESPFTPTCFGNNEVIVTDAYPGEYSVININPNTQYTFTSSVGSDYITITNADASFTYLKGYSPLVWVSGSNSGTIRYYLHNSPSCGASSNARTRYIACQGAAACGTPSGFAVSGVTASGATVTWAPASPVPLAGYQYFVSAQNTAPQGNSQPSGSTASNSAVLSGLSETTTYYIWVRSNCATELGSWVSAGNFTTNAIPFCNTADFGLYPEGTVTPNCSGTPQLITDNAYAGEYCNISIGANVAYTFSSSVATDYITITNASGSVKLAQGTTPLSWNSAGNSGTVRYYLHADSSCGSQQSNRSRFINCQGGAGCPAPSAVTVGTVTASSGSISWTPPATAPSSGYHYYYNTSGSAPTVATSPSGNASGASVVISGLANNTVYHVWVRSNCGAATSAWVSGGSFNTSGAATCNAPTGIQFFGQSTNGVTIMWTNATPAPSNGYHYYYSTANVAPTVLTDPSGSAFGGGVSLSDLQSNTVYYVWVRSNCGSMTSAWVSGGSFTTLPATSFCNTASFGQFPQATVNPTCTGNAQLIANNAYAGEYSNVSISPNTQYTFSSSVATDYITITSADGMVLLAQGITPLSWNSAANSGVKRYYLHTNSSCGEQEADRNKYITCSGTTGNCAPPSNVSSVNVTSNSAGIVFTASTNSSATYDIYFSTNSASPVANTNPSGNAAGTNVILNNLQSGATYYFWVRSNCGGTNSGWIPGGSFVTSAALNCNGSLYGLYPATTFVPACGGGAETIVTDAYAGEFSNIAVVANRKYTFTSSVATDFITITNASGSVVAASGVTPLVWASGANTGTFRYFIHGNSSCSNVNTNRVRSVACEVFLGAGEFEKHDIRVYPNPASDVVNISGADLTKLELMTVSGQLVRTHLLSSAQSQINISDLPGGVYLLRIHADDKTTVRKIVKQ